ncbi:hypothetical protein [Kribbella swartbergensis]
MRFIQVAVLMAATDERGAVYPTALVAVISLSSVERGVVSSLRPVGR